MASNLLVLRAQVLFGYNTTSADYYYANDQVFAKDLLLPVCKELRALQAAGKPAVLKKKLTVMQKLGPACVSTRYNGEQCIILYQIVPGRAGGGSF